MDIQLKPENRFSFKKLAYFTLPILLGVSLWAAINSNANFVVEEGQILTDYVVRDNFYIKARGMGSFIPKEMNIISSGVSGVIESIKYMPGQKISNTETVFVLKNNSLHHEKERSATALSVAKRQFKAESNEKKAKAIEQQLDELQASIDFKKIEMEYRALLKLREKDVVSAIDYQKMELEKELLHEKWQRTIQYGIILDESIKSRLEASSEVIKELEKQYLQSVELVDMLNVKAGSNGVITDILVDIGENVDQGRALAKYYQNDDMYVRIEVSESLIGKISLGQRVEMRTYNSNFSGVVSHVSPVAHEGVVNVFVEPTSSLPKEARPDLGVEAIIYTKELKNVLYVDRPENCVEQSSCSVYLVDRNTNIAKLVTLKSGIASDNQIEVLSGLKMGDEIIVSETSAFKSENVVKIR